MPRRFSELSFDTSLSLSRLMTVSDPITGALFKITATDLQTLLNVTASAGFKDVATPSTNPGTPTGSVWYFAGSAGTYTNFKDVSNNPLVVSSGDVNANLVILSVTGAVSTKSVVPLGVNFSNYYDKTTSDGKFATISSIQSLNTVYTATIQEGTGTTEVLPYATNYYTEATSLRNFGAIAVVHQCPAIATFNGIRVSLYCDAGTTGEIRVYRTMTAPVASQSGVNPTLFTLVKTYPVNNDHTSSADVDLIFDSNITVAANEYLYICGQSFNGTQFHSMMTASGQSSFNSIQLHLFITSPPSSFSTSWVTGTSTTLRSRPVKYLIVGTTYSSKSNAFFPTKDEYTTFSSNIQPVLNLYNIITQPGTSFEYNSPYDVTYYSKGQANFVRNLGAISIVHDVPANVTIHGVRVEVQADAGTTGEIRVYRTTTAPTAGASNINPAALFTLIKTFTVNNNYTGTAGTEQDLLFDSDISLLATEYLYIFCQSFNGTLWHTLQVPSSAGNFATTLPYLFIISPGSSFGTAWSTGSSSTPHSQPAKYLINYLPVIAKPNNFYVTKAEFGSGGSGTVTIANSDKIAITGCSYTAGHGTSVQGKAWINLLSNWTNFIIHNFAVSGSKFTDITDRIRRNTSSIFTSRSIGIKDINARFTILNNIGNETANYQGVDTDLYIQEVQEAIDAVKSIGSFPVITTDWMIRNASLVGAMQILAERQGTWFHDIGSLGDKLLTIGTPAVRWYGTHPDTRGQAVTWSEMKYFLDRLPKPRKVIKLFRKRTDFQATSINTLNYEGVGGRTTKWKEILTGQDGLSTANETYTDQMNNLTLASSVATRVTDEYMELLTGNALTFDTYALIEIVLDNIRNTTVDIYVKTAQNASFVFYLKNNLDPSTYEFTNIAVPPFVNIIVTKTVYDALTVVAGDTFTTSQVTDGTNPITLVMKGKMYSTTTGYMVGLTTQGNVTPVVKTTGASGTMTRTSGTGTSSIAYTQIDPNLTSYPWEMINGMGKAQGSMTNVTSLATYNSATGYYKISMALTDIALYVKYDNIKLVLNLPSTTFTISDVYCNYTGGAAKQEDKVWFEPKKAYTEKAPNNIFDSNWTGTSGTLPGKWTNNGGVLAAMSGTHSDYPTFASITNHVALPFDASNYYNPSSIQQTIAITPKYGHRKCVVRAICRVFPKLYRTDLTAGAETTTAQQITKDSYDYGTLCLAISNAVDNPNNVLAVMRHTVSVGWMEAYYEFNISPWQTGFTLKFYRDMRDVIDTTNYKNHTFDLQLCAWSCMVEGE
jgi:hypothetical protein